MNKYNYDISLIFPPTHDFAMPYIALPYLKGYLERFSSINARVVDVNLAFFRKLIGDKVLDESKIRLQAAINSLNLDESVIASINSDLEITEASTRSNTIDQGLRISPRKFGANFDLLKAEHIANSEILTPKLYSYCEELISDVVLPSRVFGINVTVEDQVYLSFIIAKILKKLYPQSLVIMGGNIVTRTVEILKTYNITYVDYFFVGESELSLLNFVKECIEITKISDKAESNKFIETAKTLDLSIAVPPNFSDLNMLMYSAPFAVMPVQASRRCLWSKCDFCAIHRSWHPITRQRTISDVIDEIKHHVAEGIRYFRFVDEHFPASYAHEFSDAILASQLDIRFEMYSRIEEEFLSTDLCGNLYKSGCRQIFWGVESVGAETLTRIDKGGFYTLDNIEKVLNCTSNAGILNYAFILIGIPNTPIVDEDKTIGFICNNKDIHAVSLGTFVVDMLSPIHMVKAISDKYKITVMPDYSRISTEVPFRSAEEEKLYCREDVNSRAFDYVKKIFDRRPDLAVSILLDEERRFILSDFFGNGFAQQFASKSKSEIAWIQETAINKMMSHKIERIL